MSTVRKLILIPDYKPLYAMEKCFGPLHGPLSKPCPTPVDIIGKLLQQKGQDSLSIFEVIPDPKNPKMMLEPVQLTLENYKLPYEEIANLPKELPKVIIREPEVKRIPVAPKKISKPSPDPKREEQVIYVPPTNYTIPVPADQVEDVKTVCETSIPDEISEVGVVDTPAESTDDTDAGKTSPYAGMTKAERKRARREAAAAAQASIPDTTPEQES